MGHVVMGYESRDHESWVTGSCVMSHGSTESPMSQDCESLTHYHYYVISVTSVIGSNISSESMFTKYSVQWVVGHVGLSCSVYWSQVTCRSRVQWGHVGHGRHTNDT